MATNIFATYNFVYDRDDGLQQVLTQREYRDVLSGSLLTPITGKFIARVVTTKQSKVAQPKLLKARHVLTYILNPNVVSGISELTAYIPYKPGDNNLTAHLREIGALPRVECSDYLGEQTANI